MPTGLGDEQLWLCPTLDNVTPFNDLSSQGNNGTAQGGLSTITDTSSGGAYAYDLDGTDDYITVPAGLACGTGDITMSAWFNTENTTFSAIVSTFLGNGTGMKTNGVALWQRNNGVYGALADNARVVLTERGTTAINNWYHYCVTFDRSGNATEYLNGAMLGTDNISGRSGSIACNPLFVGKSHVINGQPEELFDGKIDDVRVYNRVLTQSEITHLATARGIEGRPFDGLGDEQLWLCPSLENSPNDLSGNNNNGVYQNGMGTITDTAEGGSLAYDFDGVNHQYIDTGSTTVHQNTVFSYSVWIKANKSLAEPEAVMGSYEHTTGDRGPALATLAADDDATFFYRSLGYVNNANEQLKPSSTVFDNTWRHVVCIFDGDNNVAKVYKDGLLVGQKSSNVPNTVNISTSFKIARGFRQGAADTEDFLGLLDDVRVYNRVLTQSEITHLATARGIEGRPFDGLGDEQLWLCPSLENSPNDLSGNNNNGTYNGGMGTVTDTSSGGSLAYDLDGVDDKISVANSASIQDLPAGDYSGSIWIKPDTSGGSGLGEFFNKGYETGVGWELMIRDVSGATNAIQFSERFSSAVNYGWTTNGAITLSVWQHVAYTFENSTKTSKIYVNGVEIANGTDVNGSGTYATDSANTLYVGARADNARNFDGLIDDARIYNRALTQAEITHLASQRGVLGSPATTQYNAFLTHAFRQLFQTRLR